MPGHCAKLFTHTASSRQILLRSPFYSEETEASRGHVQDTSSIHSFVHLVQVLVRPRETAVKGLKGPPAPLELELQRDRRTISSHIRSGGGKCGSVVKEGFLEETA